MPSESPADLTYTNSERTLLLQIARKGLDAAVLPGESVPSVDVVGLPAALQARRACFVTLQFRGSLRGCTGTLLPRQPLANEVFDSTIRTAVGDPRFEPVVAEEVPELALSISILSPPTTLDYGSPADLITKLRPGVDGVTLEYGIQRGTFLPQVWDKIGDPVEFLSRLCQKMGLPRTSWMSAKLKVETYQALEVSESRYQT